MNQKKRRKDAQAVAETNSLKSNVTGNPQTLCNTSKDQDQQEETTGGKVWQGSWAHQSDLLRRLPPSRNRSRKISDSIKRIWAGIQSHLLLHESFSFFAHLIIHHEVLEQKIHQEVLDMYLLGFHLCRATCEAAAAVFSNFLSPFSSVFEKNSLC